MERIFERRYGSLLPDDDVGRGDLLIALNHIAHRHGDVIAKMVGWGAKVGTVDAGSRGEKHR